MKHTPGPWISDGADILAPETRFRYKDAPLASINVESEMWANDARLIAAAPDMLQALKAVFMARAPQLKFDFSNSPDMRMLKAAIDKAEGKSLNPTPIVKVE